MQLFIKHNNNNHILQNIIVMSAVMIIDSKTISTHGRNHNVESTGTNLYCGVRLLKRFHIFIFFFFFERKSSNYYIILTHYWNYYLIVHWLVDATGKIMSFHFLCLSLFLNHTVADVSSNTTHTHTHTQMTIEMEYLMIEAYT